LVDATARGSLMKAWLDLALGRAVVLNATRIALVVGTLLNAINQGSQILDGARIDWPRFLLNFVVPYVVSTVSAVQIKRKSSSETDSPR